MHITILGNGKSRDHYVHDTAKDGKLSDETWCINAIGGVVHCDRIIMMDDISMFIDRPNYQWIRKTKTPIWTSKVYPRISKKMVKYPFKEICEKYNTRYFSNTVAYAIALALHEGVDEISLFGCDYDYNGAVHEINRSGTEFWLGICHALGMKVRVSDQSSLMNMNGTQSYAYDTQKG